VTVTVRLGAGLVLVWLLDLELTWLRLESPGDWLPVLCGPVAAGLLFAPRRWLSAQWRAGVAVVGSLGLTLDLALPGRGAPDWGLLETVSLLILLGRTSRVVRRPAAAVALSAGLAAAVIDEPLRTGATEVTLAYPFALTFAVGGAVGLGCYLRLLDARAVRAAADIRHAERLRLARDLHDSVAHHVTGIVVQAQAAGTIHRSAPDHVEPILRNIADAGLETLDSMRRLVRVLRADERPVEHTGELCAELAKLVAAFSQEGIDTRLEIGARARRMRIAPEVESSVHRVVQESLTNVRRHAPGACVTVRLDSGDGRLRVEVHNTAPVVGTVAPAGGRGGFGLMGLRERAEAVDGDLEAGGSGDGGWRVTATFPARPEPALQG
jgi:signal transduction histidine kinase